jgi:hypothetical protein
MKESKSNLGGRDFWEDVRDTVLDGMRELRDKGDEFTRRSRIRMDMMQAQRRLRHAYEALGESIFTRIRAGETLTADDTAIRDYCTRVDYYRDELSRLRAEFQKTSA